MITTTQQDRSERERQMLQYLRRLHDRDPDKYFKCMDLGGTNGSYHSGLLAKLVRKGLVESRRRVCSMVGAMGSCRAGKEYRLASVPSADADSVSCVTESATTSGVSLKDSSLGSQLQQEVKADSGLKEAK